MNFPLSPPLKHFVLLSCLQPRKAFSPSPLYSVQPCFPTRMQYFHRRKQKLPSFLLHWLIPRKPLPLLCITVLCSDSLDTLPFCFPGMS